MCACTPALQCAVVARTLQPQDPEADVELVAFVVWPSGASLSNAAARAALAAAARLPPYALPIHFEAVPDALPTVPTTLKCDRQGLAKRPLRLAALGPGRGPPLEPDCDAAFPSAGHPHPVARLFLDALGLGGGADPQLTFGALGGTSLAAVRLQQRLRSIYGARTDRLSVRQVLDSTAAGLQGCLEDPSLPPEVDLGAQVRECARQLPSSALRARARRPRAPPGVVLLTGATGQVGGHLLHRLLTGSGATVCCLLRRPGLALPAGTSACDPLLRRLLDALEARGLRVPASAAHRIRPVAGDISLPGLGVAEADRAALVATVDVVVHVAAAVDPVAPYARLAAANVVGTREALRLAFDAGAGFHYMSTTAVFPPVGTPEAAGVGRWGELRHELAALERGLHTRAVHGGVWEGYAQTKWVAEQLVWVAAARGLPVAVHRVGHITGPAAGRPDTGSDATRSDCGSECAPDGRSQSPTGGGPAARCRGSAPLTCDELRDTQLGLLSGCVVAGAVPSAEAVRLRQGPVRGGSWFVELTPVDYVCEVVARGVLAPAEVWEGRSFHIGPCVSVPAETVFARLRARKYTLQEVGWEKWRQVLEDCCCGLRNAANPEPSPSSLDGDTGLRYEGSQAAGSAAGDALELLVVALAPLMAYPTGIEGVMGLCEHPLECNGLQHLMPSPMADEDKDAWLLHYIDRVISAGETLRQRRDGGL